jgi:hypothetical protein
MEVGGGRGNRQRQEQDAEARWESAAEAQQAAVAESSRGGTTASVQITDTHLNQSVREGLFVRGNLVIPGSEGILSAAESSNRIERFHTAGAVACAVSMPTAECPTREADADREAGVALRTRAMMRMCVPTAVQEAGAVCWADPVQVQVEVHEALRDSTEGILYFTMEHFQNLQPSGLGCKRHNEALKYFRQYGEANGSIAVIFHRTNPAKMSEIVHDTGMAFHFIGEPIIEWHWSEMVAQLDVKSLEHVVEGHCMDPDRSRGLACCRLQKTTRYDHKRHYAESNTKGITSVRHEEQYCEWDFVLTRENGTEVWLHPSYSNTKIKWLEAEVPGVPNLGDADVPTSGLGGTSGPGTCKYYKEKNQKGLLRFKANDKGKGKGQGKAQG